MTLKFEMWSTENVCTGPQNTSDRHWANVTYTRYRTRFSTGRKFDCDFVHATVTAAADRRVCT